MDKFSKYVRRSMKNCRYQDTALGTVVDLGMLSNVRL
jgi:hypothetical protein